MTDLNKKREEIKRQIRSLLESAPLGLTLHELKRDYKIFIGSQFPTRELGFNRDEDFLSAIDDVVHVSLLFCTHLMRERMKSFIWQPKWS